ncbi:hypothetical protein CENA302_00930 [Cylindrospermopsis raciborskii CENA302]|uniref:Uncharacterized protein n=1 Tax=Cylindrospermopsis raciborskii CENA302 TaxID=1170768 RepID=A0A9Q5QZ27_9CYAN|nr:hypothetical protein BCV64_05035 [Cylindrospermopsis raciborskii MVCC14]OPH11273.1 hypothetical protein CENA302_00930 [Cylindrospermopsis raciborskii CENA302]
MFILGEVRAAWIPPTPLKRGANCFVWKPKTYGKQGYSIVEKRPKLFPSTINTCVLSNAKM